MGRVHQLIPLILHHHERYDGTGYNSMMGDDIPLGARIIAVADVYDAMTSDRPYRKALTPTVARTEIISNSGTKFDPVVVYISSKYFRGWKPIHTCRLKFSGWQVWCIKKRPESFPPFFIN